MKVARAHCVCPHRPLLGNITNIPYIPIPGVHRSVVMPLFSVMANMFELENGRREALLNVFETYNIPIKPTSIGDFTAEPFLQAILCFLESTRTFATEHVNAVLPCIIVLIFGLSLLFNIYFILSHTMYCPLPFRAIIRIQISRWKGC